MENEENKVDVDTTNEDVELELSFDEDTAEEAQAEERKEEKAPESSEAKIARLKRQLEREEKKAGIKTETKAKTKSEGLDYGQLAFLAAKGIESEEEVSYVESMIKETGKELRELITKDWFKAELKEMRESKAAGEAIPKGIKRSGQTASDTVEYWISKGGLPKDNPELARKVVNARIKANTDTNKFTSNPVVK